MEEDQKKVCPNCKRDIPVDNFVIHSVHCARNIRVCPVCKEPVPATELAQHHDKMHKLLPCKKCGEAVCGADLEDHIRDSCALTAAPCRYCQLELPRKELPAHESYCGARTEPCPDCGEYVMIKYRQIHLDSNHGFLKLDDEPGPAPRDENPLVTTSSPILRAALNGSGESSSSTRQSSNIQKTENCTNLDLIRQRVKSSNSLSSNGQPPNYNDAINTNRTSSIHQPSRWEATGLPSRTDSIGILNRLGSTGLPYTPDAVVINRPESTIPDRTGPAGPAIRSELSNLLGGYERSDPLRLSDSSSGSSGRGGSSRTVGINNNLDSRKNSMMKRMNDQPQINTSVSSANKVDKNLVGQPHGAIKKRRAPRPPPDPAITSSRDMMYWNAMKRRQDEERQREAQSAYNLSVGLPPVLSPAAKLEKLRKLDALHNRETYQEPQRSNPPRANGAVNDFSNLTPMTNEEFMSRFESLGLRNENRTREGFDTEAVGNSRVGDRFNEIKRDLRELRRGLNEVTAPYNAGTANSTSPEMERHFSPRRDLALDAYTSDDTDRSFVRNESSLEAYASDDVSDDMDVELPCEFCGIAIPAQHLVLHQTGCRPDLVQLQRSPTPQATQPTEPEEEAVIPCEFCSLSLPIHLIAAHQLNCGILRNHSNVLDLPD